MPKPSPGLHAQRQGRVEEEIFDYCHQRGCAGKTDRGVSEPVPATGQGICKPCLFSGHDRTGLAVSALSSFIALIFLARGRYGH